MLRFSNKHDPVRILKRRTLIVFLLLLVVVVVRGVSDVYHKERESRRMRDAAELQLSDLRSREASLRGDVSRLKSQRGIEDVLREEYDLARKGEGVIVIVESETTESEERSRTQDWMKELFGGNARFFW